MSYIIKKSDPMVNLKLTNIGRRNLSAGNLSFVNFSLGDGEMDYTSFLPQNINILRPADYQHDIQYPVPSEGSNYRLPISVLTSVPTVVHATAKERGFFKYSTGGTVTIDTSLCTVAKVTGSTSTFANKINLRYNSTSIKHTNFKTTIDKGDYLFIKFKTSGYTANYTAPVLGQITPDPVQYLMYSIESINGAASASLTAYTTGSTYLFALDRDLPDYNKYKVEAYIYPGTETTRDYYDNDTPIAYWSGGLLGFTSNCSLTNDDVPVWNMNIINIEDVIGLDDTIYKGRLTAKGKNYWGTAVNYDYFLTSSLHKVGVLHYTNNSVSNFYAEGFYNNTFRVKIPYLMWHKQQFGGAGLANTIGYTFVCDSTLKTMGGNNSIKYYDLVDQEVIPTVVGKVLVDEKIVLIEHQELLSVLSYKGNRNWTLPSPVLNMINPGVCDGSSYVGSLQPGETLHATYLFMDTSGTTGMQCEGFSSVVNTGTTAQDVVFHFTNDPLDPTYSEFGFLMDYKTFKGIGYRTNSVLLLWQKTSPNVMPAANNWSYYNINNYVGTNGCLTMGGFQNTCENFQLHSESAIYPSTSFTGATPYTLYALTQKEIGDILVVSGNTFSGKVLTAAKALTTIGVNGSYYVYPKTTLATADGRTIVAFKTTSLVGGNFLQFRYLVGTATTSATVRQDIVVPSTATLAGYNYTNEIYNHGAHVALTLDEQPNNNVVWLFYNGQLVSSNNYGVYTTGTTANRRVELTFTPTVGSNITLYYLDNSGLGGNPTVSNLTAVNLNNLRVNIDNNLIKLSSTQIYNLNDFISLPLATNISEFSFGDEVSFFGNITTDVKATIYKTLMTCNVLPNKFINSANPTFNAIEDKVALTEIGIYDGNDDLVAIGKFSQPLTRKYNSDMLVIQASIDF